MSIINFTVEYDQLASQTDGSDMGADADLVALVGTVVFTPQFSDNRPLLAADYSPRPAGVKLLPVSGYVDSDGQLKSTISGSVGVRLPANDPVLELDKLVYKVEFRLRTPLGEPVTVDGGFFEAPSTDTTVNLTDVLQPTGAAVNGILRDSGYAEDIIDSGALGRDVVRSENETEFWDLFGTVPPANLPSYVDDVVEYNNLAAFPVTGETGKIYVARDTGDSYRWSGSTYIRISDRILSTGITDSTAVGRSVITAATQSAGRSALSAAQAVNVTVKTVKPSGGDFTSPKLACDWVNTQSPSANNQFDIWIYPGTYTEIQWTVPAYTTLRGIGNRDECWLKGEQPDSVSDTNMTDNSTIQVQSSCSLINLKITAKNLRYPVHSEASGANPNAVHTVDGCWIEHYGNQSAIDYRAANSLPAGSPWTNCLPWGYGSASGVIETFTDTTFIGPTYGAWYIHNREDFTKPTINSLQRCRIINTEPTKSVITIQGLGSGQVDRVNISDCEVSGGNFIDESDTPWITTTAAGQYANHSDIRVTYSGPPIGFKTSNRGKALKITTTSAGTATAFYGDLIVSGSGATLGTLFANFATPDHTVDYDGVITNVAVGVYSTGYFGLSVGTITGSTFTERVRTSTFAADNLGLLNFNPNLPVYAGETVAIWGTAGIYNENKAGSTARGFTFSNGAVSTVLNNRTFGYKLTLTYSDSVPTVRVSGTASNAVFGTPTYRDGGGGIPGYVYGSLDISGIQVGINSNVSVNNTLGKRLGDCSTAPKTLTVTVGDASPINVVFNTNLTSTANSTIISTINTALGSAATAAEYLVSQGEVYPDFPDRQVTLTNTSAVGIPRWSAVKLIAGRAQLFSLTDPPSALFGVAVEPIPPGGRGKVLTEGLLLSSQMAGAPTVTSGLPIYHSDSTPGAFATTGTRLFGYGAPNGFCQFRTLTAALTAKENSITAGTTAQYWRGDKTWQTLNKSAVGLGNVDNTSDDNKPISTATQSALNAKLDTGATAVAATKLETARTIDGQSFDGTANITVIAPGTNAATVKSTPADNDQLPLVDSDASNVLKKLTWTNLKAAIKSYYDSVSASLSNKDLTSATNTFPTFNQNTTGSAAKLTTARRINGVAFDGSADITTAHVDSLTNAVQTIPRWSVGPGVTIGTGTMLLAYFTADQSLTAANIVAVTSGTAAAATPTLCRFGLYSVDGSENLTLIASTANDTTLFASTVTAYTKAFSATASITAGSRYAVGLLIVSSTTMPSFYGQPGLNVIHAVAPRRTGAVSGQTDLPSSVSSGSISNASNYLYARITT